MINTSKGFVKNDFSAFVMYHVTLRLSPTRIVRGTGFVYSSILPSKKAWSLSKIKAVE